MKKYIKLLILIILIITLTGCKDTSHRKLFNQLYDENFEIAKRYANDIVSNKGVKNIFYVYELSEIVEGHKFDFLLNHKAIYKNEGIDRVILSDFEFNGKTYWGLNIIEFETIEAAEKMLTKEEIDNIDFVRYENIVYNMDAFGFCFIYGFDVPVGAFYCSEDGEILNTYDTKSKVEIYDIPDSVKYILSYALQVNANVKKIVCGENLEKIGLCSCRRLDNLEYFKANSKLKSISEGALSDNPKLKTVILNEGLEYIGEKAFAECPSLEYVVIPSSVKDIGYRAFTHGVLYIEAESKPAKWDRGFAGPSTTIYWGNEWEYNEDGIPEPINE